MIYQMLAIWSLIPLPFLNPAWTSGISWFTYCWSLVWRILSITLLVCEVSAIVWYFEHSLALPFFGTGIKTDLFQSCGHCWVFQICWHMDLNQFYSYGTLLRRFFLICWYNFLSLKFALYSNIRTYYNLSSEDFKKIINVFIAVQSLCCCEGFL